MAKLKDFSKTKNKQKYISIKGETYNKIKEYCSQYRISKTEFVNILSTHFLSAKKDLTEKEFLELIGKLDKKINKKIGSGVCFF